MRRPASARLPLNKLPCWSLESRVCGLYYPLVWNWISRAQIASVRALLVLCLLWLSLAFACPRLRAQPGPSSALEHECKCKPYLKVSGRCGVWESLCADQWPRSTSQATVVGTTYVEPRAVDR